MEVLGKSLLLLMNTKSQCLQLSRAFALNMQTGLYNSINKFPNDNLKHNS